MGKRVKVVIGANFGDEGKGLMTDYFCNKLSDHGAVLNVRHNGGAQAGHTVVTPDGERHVFSHFGAGSFNPNVATFLSKGFILNPILFSKECKALHDEFGMSPMVFVDRRCRVTTPYDMLINQIVERSRGEARHGSCGVGINETIVRYDSDIRRKMPSSMILTAGNLLTAPLESMCWFIRHCYVPERLKELGVDQISTEDLELLDNQRIVRNWANQVREMAYYCCLVDSHNLFANYDNIVFEGAQGLLLDTDYLKFAPHLTSSKTGSVNPKEILIEHGCEGADVEFCYVTRSYFTRHGAGPFPTECAKSDLFQTDVCDKTNHKNEFQGSFRYGYFDPDTFRDALRSDMSYKDNLFPNKQYTIAVTHLNETSFRISMPDGEHAAIEAVRDYLPIRQLYISSDETRCGVCHYKFI